MARMGTFTDASGRAWKFWKGRWRKSIRAVTKGEHQVARSALRHTARVLPDKPGEEVGRG